MIHLLVPTRSRVENMKRLLCAIQNTQTGQVKVQLLIDSDDPSCDAYMDLVGEFTDFQVDVTAEPHQAIGPRMNEAASLVTDDIVGFMGDDHLPRTPGWDQHVTDGFARLHEGVVYGNDLIQGPLLPTAVFLSKGLVQTLGYMCPPGVEHLFLDNAWLTWGSRIGRLQYLEHVVIEHLHPVAGSAAWDTQYVKNNHPEQWAKDEAAWQLYCQTALPGDLAKLKTLIGQ